MNKSTSILIADDNKAVLKTLELLLEDYFDNVVTVSNPNRIPSLLREHSFNVFLLDMNFSAGINTGNEGIFWLNEIKKSIPDAQVIFITAYGEIELAVKAVKHGAFDFILKPWENKKLIEILLSAVSARNSSVGDSENKGSDSEAGSYFLKGNSQAMAKIFETIEKVSKTDASILILGENGSGKEVIAREIHKQSQRWQYPFQLVDINALNEDILESELFGHSKGAFSGADADRKGKFEEASGGTLFLDEIANLSHKAQTKLLTTLQRKKVSPVGSSHEIQVDVRLICATNGNIHQMLEDGSFRQDLFYRINTLVLNLPPLRDCKEDIVPLADFFLDHYSRKYDRSKISLDKKASQKLEEYTWPGNIRELKHMMEKTVILSDKAIISKGDLFVKPEINTNENPPQPLDEMEKDAIIRAIQFHHGNMTKVAKDLNITRQTLYNKMKRHGI